MASESAKLLLGATAMNTDFMAAINQQYLEAPCYGVRPIT
jgi:hypothetical protein